MKNRITGQMFFLRPIQTDQNILFLNEESNYGSNVFSTTNSDRLKYFIFK